MIKNNTAAESKRSKLAICYDFDRTLSPDDMQSFTLIPSFGINKSEFWEESNRLAVGNLMDNNLAWMFQLIKYSRFKERSLKREYFKEIGADIKLYSGVREWFSAVNAYADKKGLEIEHYIISSGLKEIIEGSPIASEFKRIYASSYLYSTDGVAQWPAQAVNYTNKTQYIFRIAKGCLEEYDERVNDTMDEASLAVPYENIVYIGDSATDVPCMRLVKSKGGYSIGVFDPELNSKEKVYSLFNDGRISFYAPADYTETGELFRYVCQIIDEVAAGEAIKAEKKALQMPAEAYRMKTELIGIMNSDKVDADERNELKKIITALDATVSSR